MLFFFHHAAQATLDYFAVADCIATLMKGGARRSNRFHHFPECAGTRCNTLSHGKTIPGGIIYQAQTPVFKLPEIEIVFVFQVFFATESKPPERGTSCLKYLTFCAENLSDS